MRNLTEHAKRELELIKAFDEEGDFYGGMTGKAVMELIKVFSEQGHSGMSAGIVLSLFSKLANWENISPLTFNDDEWNEIGTDTFQNNRFSSVFKEGKNGRPYYLDAYYLKNQNGNTFEGSLKTKKGVITRCYIKDVKKMPRLCIDVEDLEDNKETGKKGTGGWTRKIVHPKQIEELKKYYDVEFKKIK